MVLPSSTVMTPSLPTLAIASAMILPMSRSLLEATVATFSISSVLTLISLLMPLSLATMSSTAFSMPRFMSIGLAPETTARRPSLKIASARTVAVVVPSPATSLVLLATSLHHAGAHVLVLVFQFDFLGDGDAVLGDGRRAEALLKDDVAALGPERHLDGPGQLGDAPPHRFAGFLVERNLLRSHRASLRVSQWSVVSSQQSVVGGQRSSSAA